MTAPLAGKWSGYRFRMLNFLRSLNSWPKCVVCGRPAPVGSRLCLSHRDRIGISHFQNNTASRAGSENPGVITNGENDNRQGRKAITSSRSKKPRMVISDAVSPWLQASTLVAAISAICVIASPSPSFSYVQHSGS